MDAPADPAAPPELTSAIVLRVEEERCHVGAEGSVLVIEYAPPFPRPRSERVAPGHRLALATAGGGRVVALWRWYDAVVIGAEGDVVRLWEPAHGEVLASPRYPDQDLVGTSCGSPRWVDPAPKSACSRARLPLA